MSEPGKVVRILSSTEVVVNLGSADFVTIGDRFLIYNLGEEIEDPETREKLGRLEVVRGRAEAKHVQERMTTLRSAEKQTTQEFREKPDPFSILPRIVPIAIEVMAPLEGVRVGDLVRRL